MTSTVFVVREATNFYTLLIRNSCLKILRHFTYPLPINKSFLQWRINVVSLVTHKGNQVHSKGAQYSGRANNSMKRNGRNGPERIIDSCDCSAQKRTKLLCLHFYRIRGKLKQTLGCTFLEGWDEAD